MTLSAGTRLGPYEVLGLLGAGGMGEVYRARDPRLGREVAVKVLPGDVASDPERLARFEREARAVAALNHPNILTVFDVGTHPAGAHAGGAATCHPVRRHGAARGRDAARARLAPLPDAAAGPVLRRAGGPGPRRRPREGDRPPRPQARERVRDDGRAGEGAGLRPGQARGPAGGRQRGADRVLPDGGHGAGAAAGDGRLHVAGAGARAAGGPPDGRLLARGGAVRAAGREAPLPAGHDDRDADGDPGGDAGGAVVAGAGDPAGAQRDRAPVPGEGPGGSASARRTTWRCRWRRCFRRRRGRRACRRWRSEAPTRG